MSVLDRIPLKDGEILKDGEKGMQVVDMKRITFRIPPRLLERIDRKIEQGAYPNRSEAIREILDRYLDENAAGKLEYKESGKKVRRVKL